MAYVALDYGHGENTFNDSGSKGVYRGGKAYEEHHFNADVGEQVRKILQDHGVKVLVTQPANGVDVGLTYRTNLANRKKVDILVSIHANAGSSSVSGSCVFAWKGYPKPNALADSIVKNFKKRGIGLHGNGRHYSEEGSWTNFHMLRETNMAAVLIEHGFMTNAHDFELIFGKQSKEYRKKCAEADAEAILEYFGIKYRGAEPVEIKGDYSDQQIIVVYEGADGVNIRKEPGYGRIYSAYEKGIRRDILGKYSVDGAEFFKIRGGDGNVYYIDAREKYVRVESKEAYRMAQNLENNGFKDVEADAYYAKDVKELKEAGILAGFPDGTYKPEQAITRGEMAVLLNRVRKAK